MNTGDIVNFVQLGFAAVIAILLLNSYRELIPKLLELFQQNAETMAEVATALDKLSTLVANVDQRLKVMEYTARDRAASHSQEAKE